MSTQDAPQLESLGDGYHVIAELRGRDDARTYIARRRADGRDVLLVVARPPAGDEKNALTHYAADAKLLTGLEHRNVVPVLEGRWIGNDELVVVTERVDAPTLEEMVSRGETFSAPRTAAILQEVNGVLEWAREQKVVHRAITPSTLQLEAGTDRVFVSFAIQPIPLVGPPGIEGDARTIATLASAMLASSDAPSVELPRDEVLEGRPTETLEVLRPHLPQRVVEATDALLHPSRTSVEEPDISGYISLVAMTDALRVGEAEAARIRAEVAEEQRKAREAIEAERRAFEQDMAERRRRFEDERGQLERAITKERVDLERRMAEEREALAAERAEMERSIAGQRDELEEQREAMERATLEAREVLAAERSELERRADDIDRFRVDAEEFRREVEQYQRSVEQERTELEERLRELTEREAVLARAAAVEREQREQLQRRREREREIVVADDAVEEGDDTPFVPIPVLGVGPRGAFADEDGDEEIVGTAGGRLADRSSRGWWAVSAAVVGLVAIITMSALGIGGSNRARREALRADSTLPAAAMVTPSAAAVDTRAAQPPATVIDSAAGAVSRASGAAAPRPPAAGRDSLAGRAAQPSQPTRPLTASDSALADSAARRAARAAARARADSVARRRAQRRDSAEAAQELIFGPPPLPPVKNLVPRDSSGGKPDSAKPKPDTGSGGTPRR